jgi:putative FmdB family regulatory protein
MPLYEYYCDNCDNLFEALRPISRSEEPAECPQCGAAADRIMPTTFSSMVRKQGWRQRAPFHQSDVRADKDGKKTVARVKPKSAGKTAPKAAGKPKARKG